MSDWNSHDAEISNAAFAFVLDAMRKAQDLFPDKPLIDLSLYVRLEAFCTHAIETAPLSVAKKIEMRVRAAQTIHEAASTLTAPPAEGEGDQKHGS